MTAGLNWMSAISVSLGHIRSSISMFKFNRSFHFPGFMKRLSNRQIIGILFVVALIIRLIFLKLFPNLSGTGLQENFNDLPSDFASYYDPLARDFLAGDLLTRQLDRPPFYSVFLAVIYAILGRDFLIVKVVQAILDASTAALVFSISRGRISKSASVISGALWAIYPFAVYFSANTLSETLATWLLALCTFFLMASLDNINNSLPSICLAGLLLGLNLLTRMNGIFLILLVPVLIALRGRSAFKQKWTEVVFHCLLFVAFVILPISLWPIRNSIAGQPLLDSHGSALFFQGSIEEYLTAPIAEKRVIVRNVLSELPAGLQTDLFKAGLYLQGTALRNSPMQYITFLAKKFSMTWYMTEQAWLTGEILAVQLPVLFFALLGLASHAKRKGLSRVDLFLVIIFSFSLFNTAINPLVRFMIPAMPYVLILTAVGMEQTGHFLVRKSWAIQGEDRLN